MKRAFGLVLVSFLLGLPLCTPGIAGDCTPHKIGSWFSDSNEYLYVSEADYKNDMAYECQSSYCGTDDFVLVTGAHYLDGKNVADAHSYRCQLGGDDKWVVEDVSACSNPDSDCNVPYASLKFNYADNYVVSKSDHTGVEFKTAHHKYSDLCTCTYKQAEHAFELACVKKYQPIFDKSKKVCEDSGGKWLSDKIAINSDFFGYPSVKVNFKDGICEKSFWSGDMCHCPDEMGYDVDDLNYVKCVVAIPLPTPGEGCDAGDLPQYATAGKWIANGRGGNITCAATACQNGTYLVVNTSGASQGWCTAPIKCENGTMRIIDNTKTDRTCVDDSAKVVTYDDESDEESPEIPDDESDVSEVEPEPIVVLDNCDAGVAGFVRYQGRCITTREMQKIYRAQTEKISDISQDLKSLSNNFGRSHWKTADGNFNGARLASDGIAGIVLGTAGGLVTGKVIKKNQIKKVLKI